MVCVFLQSSICACFMEMNKAKMGKRERRRSVEETDKTGFRKEKVESRRRLLMMNFNKDETTFTERENGRGWYDVHMPNLELTHSGLNSQQMNYHPTFAITRVSLSWLFVTSNLTICDCYHMLVAPIHTSTYTGIYACVPTNIFNHVSCCGITCLFIIYSSRFSRCDKVTTNLPLLPLPCPSTSTSSLFLHLHPLPHIAQMDTGIQNMSATRFVQFTVFLRILHLHLYRVPNIRILYFFYQIITFSNFKPQNNNKSIL